ncbi:class I SAM-dependent methyltransferase [uncultured Pseudoxanthomonas sp.]|uniref:class I SAM-dependent methyltransferase n=1 Tax=uncultured Pseudoxanthomonas sp. TaxID=281701 RepID=UPI002612AF48|nr:class I SAM-dependent methyltransferase [uncultured Pseudoxanthomonas sp.]
MSSTQDDLASRARSEAEFHDARINITDERRLSYAYESVRDVYTFAGVPQECLDKRVLEVGCFRGDQALALRGFEGKYTGIDISPAAVNYCNQLGLPARFDFVVDDANVLESVGDGSVDYAFGNGVLHHLDLPRFAPVLAGKLSANGYARFVEPAQGNFVLRMFRKLTPKLRTPDEFPFDAATIALLEKHFDVRVSYQAFLRPYLPMLLFNSAPATRVARWLDDRLLKLRWLQGQAWLLQIELRKRAVAGGQSAA